jgi:hypothetical protein
VEAAITRLGYPSLTLARPSRLDGGPRAKSRPGERFGLWFAGIVGPFLPARYRAVTADAMARTLLAAALVQAPEVHVMESERIA